MQLTLLFNAFTVTATIQYAAERHVTNDNNLKASLAL